MQIVTKFDIGQKVWMILENRIKRGIIESIRTYTSENGEIGITYQVVLSHRGTETQYSVNENMIIGSKEEILSANELWEDGENGEDGE